MIIEGICLYSQLIYQVVNLPADKFWKQELLYFNELLILFLTSFSSLFLNCFFK